MFVIAVSAGASALGPPTTREYAIQCVENYARAYQVPVEVGESVIDIESNWNPDAISHSGAVGLMQLMPETAIEFGVRNRFEIEENVRGGVAYLAWLIRLLRGDLRLAMGAYVAGHGAIMSCDLAYSSRAVYEYVSDVARHYRQRLKNKKGGSP